MKQTHQPNYSRRLTQILHILKKHHITKGLTPLKLRLILEDLGPTFVKIGQLMSTRQDLFSQAYCDELSTLRSHVQPLDFPTIEQQLIKTYGHSWHSIFPYFHTTPIGSASIAQVHQATLQDGRNVVVKIQRPYIYDQIKDDITLLKKACRILHIQNFISHVVDIHMVLDEFWNTAEDEMNFLKEAEYTKTFHDLNSPMIQTPYIVDAYTTETILVMEYIDGISIDQCLLDQQQRKEIAKNLAHNFLKQVIEDGFFHADLHPGNIKLRNSDIVYLDFGMMGILRKEDRELLKTSLIAVTQEDIQKLADCLLMLGKHSVHIDYMHFYNDIDSLLHRYIHNDLKDIPLADLLQDLFHVAYTHHIRLPKGISILARSIITMESTLNLLDPTLNLLTLLKQYVKDYILQHHDIQKEINKQGKKVLSSLQHSIDLPIHLSQLLSLLSKGRAKINLEITDSYAPLSTIDHMINKLTVGIISTGLLLASSILCTTQMNPKLFGIPALGCIGYLIAVCLGLWLVYTVIKNHRRK